MAVIVILLGDACKDARVHPEMLQDNSCFSLSSLTVCQQTCTGGFQWNCSGSLGHL